MKIVLYKTYIILAGIILLNNPASSQNKLEISGGIGFPEAVIIPFSDSTNHQPDLTLMAFYQQGWVLPTNAFVKGNNVNQMPIETFRTASLQMSVQTKGEKLWQQLYNYPMFGAGINTIRFINAPYLGKPVSAYSTLSIPLLRWESFSLYSDFGLGLTFNWGSYREDKYNIAIGTGQTLYFNEGFSLEYKSREGLVINAGTSFTHFSNGSLKVPNRGINIFAPKIGLGYNFAESPQEFKTRAVPEYQKHSEFCFSFFGALRNEYYYGSDVDSITK